MRLRHNWAAFGFKTKDIASNKFVFHDAENALFKEICKELNGDDNSKYAPKPDIPGVARLLHDPENHFKLSRWVYKHASEWADEADYKAEIKTFLEDNSDDDDEAQAMAGRKYERLEAKIANLAWWKDIKTEGFPASSTVYHFHPVAFLEQMMRVEKFRDIDLSDPDKWMSQFDNPVNPSKACYRTCLIILERYEVECMALGRQLAEKYKNETNKWSGVIQTVIQLSDGTLEGTGREQEGLDYLNEQLELGKPVIVGLDDERNETYNKDNTTEHFVVITGRLTDGEGDLYFRFFEVGTRSHKKDTLGVGPDNRLYLNNNNWITGVKHTSNPKRNYTVVQIRKNL